MVRIISFALSMLAMALAAQACSNCQCHFSDGSSAHCCVVSPTDGDCNRVCANAKRGKDDKPCAAGGSYNCISEITSLGRMSCKGPTSQ